MTLDELVARESVRSLVAAYNAHGDAGRLEELLALFVPDAHFDMDGEVCDGVEAIRTGLRSAGGRFLAYAKASGAARTGPVLRHYTATTHITVTSTDTAEATSYFHVLMAHGLDHWGSYLDGYRLDDGTWRIARRRVVVEGKVPGGFADTI